MKRNKNGDNNEVQCPSSKLCKGDCGLGAHQIFFQISDILELRELFNKELLQNSLAEYNDNIENTFTPPKLNPKEGIKLPKSKEEWQISDNYFKAVFNLHGDIEEEIIYLHIYYAIKFCKVHQFADDTNLLHFSKSVNKFNKYINLDMKINLTDWLNANKIPLNFKKTELVIFKLKKKKLECPIRTKLSRERLYLSNSIRYLGVKIDENLNWKDHIHDIATKLNRANALLFKIRNYVNFNTLKSIYFAIFDSHINYANLIWGQNINSTFRIVTLQKKAIRIINNQPRNSHSSLLFKKSNILKFEDKILINNIIFISKSINNLQPPIFKNWFIFCSDIRKYDTVSSSADKSFKPSYRTDSH